MATLKVPVTSNDHIQGDYQCPHCGHAYPIVQRVQKHFGKQLRFVFRNFPLNEIHPEAENAAETAEFAATHGKFWEMHDVIFENQENLGLPLYLELATKLKLAPTELEQSLASEKFLPRVKEDFMGGVRSGVNGTPTFFINGQRHDGPFEFEFLVYAIDAQLASK
jgi:protein-disulfide isomerase